MTEDSRHNRIKRLYYRSWHRGNKETDTLFGRFADTLLPDLSDAELDIYEALLQEEDDDIWHWFSGQRPTPEDVDTPIWQRFKQVNEDAVKK